MRRDRPQRLDYQVLDYLDWSAQDQGHLRQCLQAEHLQHWQGLRVATNPQRVQLIAEEDLP